MDLNNENDLWVIRNYMGPIYSISDIKFKTHKIKDKGLYGNLFTLICENCKSCFSKEINISHPPTRYSSYGDFTCEEMIIKNIIE